MGFKIISTGLAHPQKVVTNNDFSHIETSDEWISSRTGIRQRYFCTDETTKSLAKEATIKAFQGLDIDKNRVKLLIVATMTPDNFTPSVASSILSDLDIEAMAFDINVACSGFVYALRIAHELIKDDELALIIGAESISKMLDFNDRTTCVLFGDGAGAVLLEKNQDSFLAYSMSKSDSKKILYANGLATANEGKLEKCYLNMVGSEVFRFAIDAFDDCFKHLTNEGILLQDIDLIIPHQANKRIIEHVAKKFRIDFNKFYLNLDKYGNTSAASIPIAVDEALKDGSLKSGQKILLIGFGSGLAWGYVYMRI